jgi:hypothetical protein
MTNAKAGLFAGIILNILLAGLLILSTVALVQERSRDIVRVTVTDAELLRTAQELQGITGKVAYAYPVKGSNETLWRVVIDERSEVNRKLHW